MKRIFLYLLIVSIAASAILGVFILLLGEFDETELRILATSLTFSVMSLLGLACGASLEAGRVKIVAIAGISFSIVSAIVWISIIWSDSSGGEYIAKTVLTTTIFAFALSYSSLLAFAELEKKFQWAQYASYLAVAMLVGILLYTIWYDNQPNEEFLARVIGADSVIIAALTVIVPIFHKLSGPTDELEKIDGEIDALRSRLDDLEARKMELSGVKTENNAGT